MPLHIVVHNILTYRHPDMPLSLKRDKNTLNLNSNYSNLRNMY